ncbi:MAG: FAD-dependent oxidoreductase [Rhodobiaceae bacterium]|nr:FAD-dependent oxidoreductase [Rhodobiaceae bacterium]
MSAPIVIIGAGIVGVSTAIWLQRDGHDVVVIDRMGPGEGTSYGNGGVLASCSVIPVTVPGLFAKAPGMLFDPHQPLFLKWSYVPKLAPWLVRYLSHCRADETKRIAAALTHIIGDSLADHQALSAGTGAEKWLVPSDYLFLYRDRAHYEGDAFGWSIRKAQGFKWEEMDAPAFRAYDPHYSDRIGFAARCGDHGRIADPGQYVKDLAAHVEASGGRVLKADVTDFVRENGVVTGVRAGGETIACSHVIVATGVWSKPLMKALGLSVPLESERGYHLELYGTNFVPRSPSMIASGKFVVTPMEGRIRLAGIVEFGGLDAPPSRAPFKLLLNNVREALPDLTWKETKEWMGHRPAPSDSIPVIGPVPSAPNAYAAFGHHHVGLTGGPKTGRIIADMIAGRRSNFDLAPYSPARFS